MNILKLEKTEKEVCEEFDSFIESTGLFILEKEVVGRYLFGNNGMTGGCARIDRILVPKSTISKTGGLVTGPIGVEIKAVDKWGPPICQAIDYRSAAFRIFNGWANIDCVLDTVFIFPMEKMSGPIESVMTQHRVGGAYIHAYSGNMRFQLSATVMLELKKNSMEFIFNGKTAAIGRKVGSR